MESTIISSSFCSKFLSEQKLQKGNFKKYTSIEKSYMKNVERLDSNATFILVTKNGKYSPVYSPDAPSMNQYIHE